MPFTGAIRDAVQKMAKSHSKKIAKLHSKRAGGCTKTRHQYAALPVRITEQGLIEVLLLTSRETRRWIIPKGWPLRKLEPSATAAREAYEEAGIEGKIQPMAPIGYYRYAKGMRQGEIEVGVKVFLLRVERQLDVWPEQAERETRWFSPEAAAELVAEPELAAILRNVRTLVGSGG